MDTAGREGGVGAVFRGDLKSEYLDIRKDDMEKRNINVLNISSNR